MLIALLFACSTSAKRGDSSDTAPADTDADTDTDADADTDADTDADADTYSSGDGPWTWTEQTVEIAGQEVDIYTSDAPGPLPAVSWAHGFARGPQFHVAAARHAASWGFLVATPQLPSFSDHEVNAAFIADDLVPAIDQGGGIYLVGHSAGGLESAIAAAAIQPNAYVGLDPVDYEDMGAAAAPDVHNALVLHGEPASCNADGNSAGWAMPSAWHVDVTGASHCDFESDTESGCTLFCGDNDAARQELIQTYAVAWLVHAACGDANAWMETGSQAAADQAAGLISW